MAVVEKSPLLVTEVEKKDAAAPSKEQQLAQLREQIVDPIQLLYIYFLCGSFIALILLMFVIMMFATDPTLNSNTTVEMEITLIPPLSIFMFHIVGLLFSMHAFYTNMEGKKKMHLLMKDEITAVPPVSQ
jgi:hypothetical protein